MSHALRNGAVAFAVLVVAMLLFSYYDADGPRQLGFPLVFATHSGQSLLDVSSYAFDARGVVVDFGIVVLFAVFVAHLSREKKAKEPKSDSSSVRKK